MMLELTLDELKNYLRIDGSEDDEFLTSLIALAKDKLAADGVPESDRPLYKYAVMSYVALYYENRDPAQKIDALSYGLQSMILQLKDYGPSPKEG